jgi:hypothetical protein
MQCLFAATIYNTVIPAPMRRIAFLVACLLFVILTVDYALSGQVSIRHIGIIDISVPPVENETITELQENIKKRPKDVKAQDSLAALLVKQKKDRESAMPKSPHPEPVAAMVVTSPFSARSFHPAQNTYRFSIPFRNHFWDHIWPVYLKGDDCFSEISIDGELRLTDKGQCTSTIPLLNIKSKIEGVLEDRGGNFGLRIIRNSVIPKPAAIALVLGTLCLAFFSLHDTWKRWARSLYVVLLCAFFIASSFSYSTSRWGAHYYNIHDIKAWFGLMGSGVLIFTACMLSWWWLPARRLHLYALRAVDLVLRLPPRTWALGCTCVFLVITLILSHVLFGGTPHVADTHIQYVMGKIFASGHIVGTSHALPQFFDFQFTINNGKFYGHYFPGHAMLLAIGHLLHAPWVINPLFGALTVYMTYLLGRELAGEKIGMLAAFLMLISPNSLFMSSEFMSHASSIFFLTSFIYCYLRLMNTHRLGYALLAGACVGYAMLIRPQTTVFFALPIALHAIVYFLRNPRKRWLDMLVMGSAFSVFVAMLLYYNYATAGSPFVTPYDRTQPKDSSFMYAFLHPERWLTLKDDILRALANSTSLHIDLMGWPTSPFIFLLLLYVFKMQPRYSTLLLGTFFSLFISLIFFNPFSNSVFPARYVYETTGILIILIAAGIVRFPDMAKQYFGASGSLASSSLILTLVILVATAWPFRIGELYGMYSNNFWEGNSDYTRMIVDSTEKPALVFMKNYREYRVNFFMREAEIGGPIIFARDMGKENEKLMNYYPDHHVYYVDGWRMQKLR